MGIRPANSPDGGRGTGAQNGGRGGRRYAPYADVGMRPPPPEDEEEEEEGSEGGVLRNGGHCPEMAVEEDGERTLKRGGRRVLEPCWYGSWTPKQRRTRKRRKRRRRKACTELRPNAGSQKEEAEGRGGRVGTVLISSRPFFPPKLRGFHPKTAPRACKARPSAPGFAPRSAPAVPTSQCW